jgi:hypothetical protein
MGQKFNAGERILIEATVTPDQRCVMVAPGVELPLAAVEILTYPEGATAPLMLFFASPEEREAFAEDFASWPGVEARELP